MQRTINAFFNKKLTINQRLALIKFIFYFLFRLKLSIGK